MTRQEQFKAELFDLLRRYDAIVTVEGEHANFYSTGGWVVSGDSAEMVEQIDLYFRWEDGKE